MSIKENRIHNALFAQNGFIEDLAFLNTVTVELIAVVSVMVMRAEEKLHAQCAVVLFLQVQIKKHAAVPVRTKIAQAYITQDERLKIK